MNDPAGLWRQAFLLGLVIASSSACTEPRDAAPAAARPGGTEPAKVEVQDSASVPDGLPAYTVEQMYGPGAEADGGALLKKQQRFARTFVRSAFSGRLPGRGAAATIAVEARHGTNVAKVQINPHAEGETRSAEQTSISPLSPRTLPTPQLPAREVKRVTGVSQDGFEQQSARLERDARRAGTREQAEEVYE